MNAGIQDYTAVEATQWHQAIENYAQPKLLNRKMLPPQEQLIYPSMDKATPREAHDTCPGITRRRLLTLGLSR